MKDEPFTNLFRVTSNLMLPVRPWGLFYFMTEIKFICETTSNHLEVYSLEIESGEKFIEVSIQGNSYEALLNVHLTIKDAELLMDQIHKSIVITEGGKNE